RLVRPGNVADAAYDAPIHPVRGGKEHGADAPLVAAVAVAAGPIAPLVVDGPPDDVILLLHGPAHRDEALPVVGPAHHRVPPAAPLVFEGVQVKPVRGG